MHDPILLQLAVIVIAAKLGAELFERVLKQPAVLGEIVCGVLVGTSVLGWVPGNSPNLLAIGEIGAVFLLFEVGLDSDLDELFRVGPAAIWVACAGVCLPFLFGFLVASALGQPKIVAIFIGAALTATSVGITARVFTDLGALQTREARVVLGAAVVDDVIGLIILAAVSGLAVTRYVSWVAIAKLTSFAILFLVGAIVIGLRATPIMLRWACAMRTRAAVSSAAVVFCLILASIAQWVQLAPIVGAFAAGLVLAKTDQKVHFEEKIRSVADLFIPIFFVMMGARINVRMIDPLSAAGRATLTIGTLLLVVAVIGKVLGGLTVPIRGARRWVVGIGMIPRGEVGLIFASIGLGAHVIGDAIYAAIIFVVVLTTFVTPPLLKLVAGQSIAEAADEPTPLSGRSAARGDSLADGA